MGVGQNASTILRNFDVILCVELNQLKQIRRHVDRVVSDVYLAIILVLSKTLVLNVVF